MSESKKYSSFNFRSFGITRAVRYIPGFNTIVVMYKKKKNKEKKTNINRK